MSCESCCHDCFILKRVECAGRIDQPSSELEHLESSLKNLKLKSMIEMTHMTVETVPEPIIFSKSAITTARNIAQNPIKFKILLSFIDSQIWKESSIIIDNKKRW
jgi:hypothetical protein